MPRPATKLTAAARGGFIARKVIPSDVKAEYARLFGQRTEERLSIAPMHRDAAEARHREWLNEIGARIHNIRAARRGEGSTLAPRDARALAGEWYGWYVAREAGRWPATVWEDYHGRMIEEVQAAGIASGMFAGDAVELLDSNAAIRERVRPIVADEGKTAQFLAAKRLVLDPPSHALFVDFVARDFFAAVALLARRARGDYGADKWADQFPQAHTPADASLTPWALFERWVGETKPAPSSVDRWRGVFLKLEADFPATNVGALLPEQMQKWVDGLTNPERSASTVRDVWIRSCRTVFAWALKKNKLIARNPFAECSVDVPKSRRSRETKAFREDEIKLILSAALKTAPKSKADAAKRWCPWLAAYSGARMGELTQLRGVDIIEQDGVAAIKISPEAGTVKTGDARVVPLHEHLLDQGFLEFVKRSGKGALFYNEPTTVEADNPTNPRKPRSVKARESLAGWVRKIGVVDPEVSPNHAWRHSFKNIGFNNGISERVLDAICGHAPASVGRGYGVPTVAQMAAELAKFPRFRGGAR